MGAHAARHDELAEQLRAKMPPPSAPPADTKTQTDATARPSKDDGLSSSRAPPPSPPASPRGRGRAESFPTPLTEAKPGAKLVGEAYKSEDIHRRRQERMQR